MHVLIKVSFNNNITKKLEMINNKHHTLIIFLLTLLMVFLLVPSCSLFSYRVEVVKEEDNLQEINEPVVMEVEENQEQTIEDTDLPQQEVASNDEQNEAAAQTHENQQRNEHYQDNHTAISQNQQNRTASNLPPQREQSQTREELQVQSPNSHSAQNHTTPQNRVRVNQSTIDNIFPNAVQGTMGSSENTNLVLSLSSLEYDYSENTEDSSIIKILFDDLLNQSENKLYSNANGFQIALPAHWNKETNDNDEWYFHYTQGLQNLDIQEISSISTDSFMEIENVEGPISFSTQTNNLLQSSIKLQLFIRSIKDENLGGREILISFKNGLENLNINWDDLEFRQDLLLKTNSDSVVQINGSNSNEKSYNFFSLYVFEQKQLQLKSIVFAILYLPKVMNISQTGRQYIFTELQERIQSIYFDSDPRRLTFY